jgi:hypothetical protein
VYGIAINFQRPSSNWKTKGIPSVHAPFGLETTSTCQYFPYLRGLPMLLASTLSIAADTEHVLDELHWALVNRHLVA